MHGRLNIPGPEDDRLHQHSCPRCYKAADHRLAPGKGRCKRPFFTMCSACRSSLSGTAPRPGRAGGAAASPDGDARAAEGWRKMDEDG